MFTAASISWTKILIKLWHLSYISLGTGTSR